MNASLMRLSILLPALLIGVFALEACTWNCEKGAGPAVKQVLEVASFHGIAVQGSMDVQVHKADVQRVEVEAQQNLIDLISLEVKNGVWHIGTKKCYNTDKAFVVHISVPSMDAVTLQGSGGVKSANSFTVPKLHIDVQGSGGVEFAVDAKHVQAVVQGSGDIKLTGSTGAFTATVQGSGDIEADGLEASTVSADVAGSGDIDVFATGKLKAVVAGSGDISYKGTPTSIEKNIAGSGEVKQKP